MINNEKVAQFINECVEKTNEKAISRAAQIKKWKLIETDFSLPGGELTPTLKLRRKVTSQIYHDVIESLYTEK